MFLFTYFIQSLFFPQEMPEVNMTWSNDGPHPLDSIHISVAVATDRGLITPIIRDAANKGVQEISATAKVWRKKIYSKHGRDNLKAGKRLVR